MPKKKRIDEIDKLYKNLTYDKFENIITNMNNLHCALSHIALTIKSASEEGEGFLQVPLIKHPEKAFKFSIMKNKETGLEILVVEPIDAASNSIN